MTQPTPSWLAQMLCGTELARAHDDAQQQAGARADAERARDQAERAAQQERQSPAPSQ